MPSPADLPAPGQPPHHALLDSAPMGRRQYAIWLLASGGTLLDGFSIFLLGVSMPLLTAGFALSPLMIGLIGAALVLGAALGAAAGGAAADRFGRKPAFVVDMAIVAAGAVISAMADAPHWIFVGQFLVGIGIGIDFPVSASYVSETMPKSARSRMVVATIALQSVGLLLGAAVALVMLRGASDAADWRWLLGATGLCAAALLVLRFLLPESPRWLTEHGRAHEAARIAAGIVHAPLPETPSQQPIVGGKAPPQRMGLAVLFSKPYRTRTMLVSVPWFLMDIATYGVGLFTPLILAAIHLSGTATSPLAADFVDAKGTAAIDLFLLAGFLVGLWAVPRFGRLHMQVIGFAGMTLGMLILLSAVLAGGGAAAHVPIVFAGFILFNIAMNAGPNATTFALASELFPTGIRASASGFAAATAKVGATLGIFVLPLVKGAWGLAAVLLMMAVVSALGAAITAALARQVSEIPEGRGLDETAAGRA
jgi:MFS transporter, putative metabolite transport protein